MRRTGLVVLIGGAIAVLSPGGAWAAPANVTTTFDNKFNAPSFDHDPGTVATVAWTGGGPHDVRSYATDVNGQPLFSSERVFLLFPASAPINGSQFLAPGTYSFFCTVHGASMSSALRIPGTPPATGSAGSPDAAYGGLSARAKRQRCKKGRKSKRRRCAKRKRRRR